MSNMLTESTANAISKVSAIEQLIPDKLQLCQDLNPIEEAQAIMCLIEELQYTHDEVAAKLGKHRTEITNTLRLLKLDSRVRTLIINGDLSVSHGKILAGVPYVEQYDLALKTAAKNWSIRMLEQAIKQLIPSSNSLISAHKQKTFAVKESRDGY